MKMLSPALLVLALAACGGDSAKQQGGKAEGEILPASVSDAMIPIDQVRSQAPLAPVAETSGRKAAKPEATRSSAATEGADPETPQPAATADAPAGE